MEQEPNGEFNVNILVLVQLSASGLTLEEIIQQQ